MFLLATSISASMLFSCNPKPLNGCYVFKATFIINGNTITSIESNQCNYTLEQIKSTEYDTTSVIGANTLRNIFKCNY